MGKYVFKDKLKRNYQLSTKQASIKVEFSFKFEIDCFHKTFKFTIFVINNIVTIVKMVFNSSR